MTTSVRAAGRNRGTVVVWAATIVAVTGLGIATGPIGLLIAFPVIRHATWRTCREPVG